MITSQFAYFVCRFIRMFCFEFYFSSVYGRCFEYKQNYNQAENHPSAKICMLFSLIAFLTPKSHVEKISINQFRQLFSYGLLFLNCNLAYHKIPTNKANFRLVFFEQSCCSSRLFLVEEHCIKIRNSVSRRKLVDNSVLCSICKIQCIRCVFFRHPSKNPHQNIENQWTMPNRIESV